MNGKLMLDGDTVEAFGQQLTKLFEMDPSKFFFDADRYDQNFKKVSTVHWTPCEKSPAPCGAVSGYSCCEVFENNAIGARPCGVFDKNTSAFLFDRYLTFSKNGMSLIAGITLKYAPNGAFATPEEFGLLPRPPVTANKKHGLCFLLDVKCDPMTRFFQVPGVDAVYEGDDICLRVKVESQHGCVASTGKFLEMTSWKVLFLLIAPIAMFAGLLLAFLGWRLFRVTALVLGLFFGLSIAGVVIIFSVFLACEANKPSWAVIDFWNWSHECTFHYLTSNV
jgi:hypothetical protein